MTENREQSQFNFGIKIPYSVLEEIAIGQEVKVPGNGTLRLDNMEISSSVEDSLNLGTSFSGKLSGSLSLSLGWNGLVPEGDFWKLKDENLAMKGLLGQIAVGLFKKALMRALKQKMESMTRTGIIKIEDEISAQLFEGLKQVNFSIERNSIKTRLKELQFLQDRIEVLASISFISLPFLDFNQPELQSMLLKSLSE